MLLLLTSDFFLDFFDTFREAQPDACDVVVSSASDPLSSNWCDDDALSSSSFEAFAFGDFEVVVLLSNAFFGLAPFAFLRLNSKKKKKSGLSTLSESMGSG